MSLANLRRLKDAWEAQYPKQASGGETAIAGFSFQFLEVLLKSVRAWLAGDRREPRVYAECLSDIAEVKDSGVLVVTQVKYTQSSSMVIGALADLFRIYQVAARDTPDLLPRLDLRILSARRNLKSVSGTIERWCPEGVAPVDPLLTGFRALVKPEIHPDPEDELLALLANELRAEEPLHTVRGWLGKLIEAAGAGQGYVAAARDIWDDLVSLDRARLKQKATGIYVWTAADRPPDAVERGEFLTGQQPEVHHLRKGFFAPRHDIYTSIVDQIASWTGASHVDRDQVLRLPVHWIGGRSGTGKSVALLHILALLHERGVATVLFLGGSVARLPDAIRWSREVRRPGRPVLIALDDPYAPVAQGDAGAIWRDTFDELHEVRQAGDRSSMPLVVCCGPTEQFDRLRDDFPDDIALTLTALPDAMAADIQGLRAWYRDRTGEEPPAVGDENVLLVQLFFQWQAGVPMPQFASRFRKRIRSSDATGAVETALARMLAVNRLYAGACREAIEAELTPTLLDLLDRLSREHHLADNASPNRPGLWLAHPHLAEAIYESWFPAATHARARLDHLRAGILGALQRGATAIAQTAPLWAISRSLGRDAATSELARRLDEQTARAVLTEVYVQATDGRRAMPLAHLPVWIEIRGRAPALVFQPDPIDEAIVRLGTAEATETGLRLTCHKLLQHLRSMEEAQRERATAALIGLLAWIPDWHEWAHVAEDAIVRTGNPRIWDLVVGWIERQIWSRTAQRLLLLALGQAPIRPELLRIVRTELPRARPTEEWFRLALILLASSEEARADVESWIECHREDAGAGPALGQLLRKGVSRAEPWAIEWASRWYLAASANHVLEPLCAVAEPRQDVLGWGRSWVRAQHEHSGFLMERLILAAPRDEETRALGQQWLDWTDDADGSWAFVWEALWKHHEGNERLTTVARTWLLKAPAEHGSWAFTWKALWKHYKGDEQLTAVARAWLAAAPPKHISWQHVWEALRKCYKGDEQLATLARAWLAVAPAEHGSWGITWKALWKQHKGDEQLTAVGRTWLAMAPTKHGSWQHVWQALWTCHEGDEQLTAIARDWLAKAPAEHGSWAFAWNMLWEHYEGDEQLTAIARDWLAKAPAEHGSWAFVWLALWEHDKGDEQLTAIARDWLAKAPAEHGSWQYVWKALWAWDKGDEQLAAVARDWLVKAPAEHGSWKYVWESLWTRHKGDEQLAAVARDWLVKAPAEHGSWKYVWESLWTRHKGDEQLAAVARDWLVKAPAEHGSWKYVWESLWTRHKGDEQLAAVARDWLVKAPAEHGSWAFVWLALWEYHKGNEQLTAAARTWLSAAPAEHGSWAFVWLALWEHHKGDEQLTAAARTWLSAAPAEHGSWAYVWLALWERHKGDEQLAEVARIWLSAAPAEHPARYFVWKPFWNETTDRTGLLEQALQWLGQTTGGRTRWYFVWRDLWSERNARAQLTALAFDWLVTAIHDRDWVDVWMTLWNDSQDRERLRALAAPWLGLDHPEGLRLQGALRPPASKKVRRSRSTRRRGPSDGA